MKHAKEMELSVCIRGLNQNMAALRSMTSDLKILSGTPIKVLSQAHCMFYCSFEFHILVSNKIMYKLKSLVNRNFYTFPLIVIFTYLYPFVIIYYT